MRIRAKLLILLLSIALLPLLVSAVLNRVSMYRLGSHLAEQTRQALTEDAFRLLGNLVDDYGRSLQRDRETLEWAVNLQAREVERRLATPPPSEPQLFFAADYDAGLHPPPGLAPSPRHFRPGPDGEVEPIAVTYAEQVCFLPEGVAPETAAADLARLSTMPEAYRFIHRFLPELIYWQYTSLEAGIHTSYPGHGGYPSEYDPRRREWYRRARQAASPTWSAMAEVSTRTLTLSVAMPVYRPNGELAGVTAIDVRFSDLFRELRLPDPWARQAETLLVTLDAESGSLKVVAHGHSRQGEQDWQEPLEQEYLQLGDRRGLAGMAEDGAAGVRRMPYRGTDALWAYGARNGNRPFPVVIVPYGGVVAQANQAEIYVRTKTIEGAKISGLALFAVLLLVVAVTYFGSLAVTRPVRQLAETAQRLAGGNFHARVKIRTGDELQELGEIFNGMGPKLQDLEWLKQSLLLARGIQQHLLPEGFPPLEGFEIAGQSAYCDETGGDYYDYIDLVEIGPGKVGLAVGDVTGHGIGAALLMAAARGVLRSQAVHCGDDLGRLFQVLNHHLVRDTGDERFMTLFYGNLDAKARTLLWNSAGHGPVLWLRRKRGRIEELPTTGIPLGIFEDESYVPSGPIGLESGDVVLIGTDGIWEARNGRGESFGLTRLRDLLAASAERSAREIHSAVMAAIADFRAGEPQDDDITLIVIKAL